MDEDRTDADSILQSFNNSSGYNENITFPEVANIDSYFDLSPNIHSIFRSNLDDSFPSLKKSETNIENLSFVSTINDSHSLSNNISNVHSSNKSSKSKFSSKSFLQSLTKPANSNRLPGNLYSLSSGNNDLGTIKTSTNRNNVQMETQLDKVAENQETFPDDEWRLKYINDSLSITTDFSDLFLDASAGSLLDAEDYLHQTFLIKSSQSKEFPQFNKRSCDDVFMKNNVDLFLSELDQDNVGRKEKSSMKTASELEGYSRLPPLFEDSSEDGYSENTLVNSYRTSRATSQSSLRDAFGRLASGDEDMDLFSRKTLNSLICLDRRSAPSTPNGDSNFRSLPCRRSLSSDNLKRKRKHTDVITFSIPMFSRSPNISPDASKPPLPKFTRHLTNQPPLRNDPEKESLLPDPPSEISFDVSDLSYDYLLSTIYSDESFAMPRFPSEELKLSPSPSTKNTVDTITYTYKPNFSLSKNPYSQRSIPQKNTKPFRYVESEIFQKIQDYPVLNLEEINYRSPKRSRYNSGFVKENLGSLNSPRTEMWYSELLPLYRDERFAIDEVIVQCNSICVLSIPKKLQSIDDNDDQPFSLKSDSFCSKSFTTNKNLQMGTDFNCSNTRMNTGASFLSKLWNNPRQLFNHTFTRSRGSRNQSNLSNNMQNHSPKHDTRISHSFDLLKQDDFEVIRDIGHSRSRISPHIPADSLNYTSSVFTRNKLPFYVCFTLLSDEYYKETVCRTPYKDDHNQDRLFTQNFSSNDSSLPLRNYMKSNSMPRKSQSNRMLNYDEKIEFQSPEDVHFSWSKADSLNYIQDIADDFPIPPPPPLPSTLPNSISSPLPPPLNCLKNQSAAVFDNDNSDLAMKSILRKHKVSHSSSSLNTQDDFPDKTKRISLQELLKQTSFVEDLMNRNSKSMRQELGYETKEPDDLARLRSISRIKSVQSATGNHHINTPNVKTRSNKCISVRASSVCEDSLVSNLTSFSISTDTPLKNKHQNSLPNKYPNKFNGITKWSESEMLSKSSKLSVTEISSLAGDTYRNTTEQPTGCHTSNPYNHNHESLRQANIIASHPNCSDEMNVVNSNYKDYKTVLSNSDLTTSRPLSCSSDKHLFGSIRHSRGFSAMSSRHLHQHRDTNKFLTSSAGSVSKSNTQSLCDLNRIVLYDRRRPTLHQDLMESQGNVDFPNSQFVGICESCQNMWPLKIGNYRHVSFLVFQFQCWVVYRGCIIYIWMMYCHYMYNLYYFVHRQSIQIGDQGSHQHE